MVGTPDEELLLEPLRRLPAVRRLAEGPATRAELQDRLDVSRPTLHRVVTDLTAAGLAVETDDGVALTPFGREVAAAATEYADRVAAAERVAPVLNAIEPESVAVQVDPTVLATGEVVEPDPRQPQRPIQPVVEAIRSADWIRSLAPIVLPSYVDAVQAAIEEGTPFEIVFDPDALAGIEESYADEFADALETGQLDTYVTEPVPFELMVSDEIVCLVSHDEEGVLQGAVVGEDERLRAWAEECYAHYRETAEPAARGDESGT